MNNIALKHLIPLLFIVSGLIIILTYYLVSRPQTESAIVDLAQRQALADVQALQGRVDLSLTSNAEESIPRNIFFFATAPEVQAILILDGEGVIRFAHRTRLIGRTAAQAGLTLDPVRAEDVRRTGDIQATQYTQETHHVLSYAGVSIRTQTNAPPQRMLLVMLHDYSRLVRQGLRISAQPAELIATLMIALALVIGAVLHQRIRYRFEPLLDAAARISRGEKGVRTRLTGQDEFADFSRALDRLAGDVERNQKRLQEAVTAAEEANAAKSLFLANISHDVRTPLSSVMGFLELLANIDLSDEARLYARTAQGSAKSLLSLIDDIVDVSRFETTQTPADPKPTCLNILMQDILDAQIHAAQAKDLGFRMVANSDDPVWVQVDARLLRQVLLHLTSNAVRFTYSGQVSLSMTCQDKTDGQVLIDFCVTDNADPLPPSVQETLFRADAPQTVAQGTNWSTAGLSLTIIRRFTKALGGTVQIDSVKGGGNRYRLGLTLNRCTPETAEDNSLLMIEQQRPLTILVVDDNALSRLLIKSLLAKWGHRVVEADSGAAALAEMKHRLVYADLPIIDLILMDIHMPGMDGGEAALAIRGLDATTRAMPILAVTADLNYATDNAGMTAFDGVLTKPVNAQTLAEEIFRIMSRSDNETFGQTALGSGATGQGA